MERVLVVAVAGAPAPPRRRLGRTKPKRAHPGSDPATVPLTTLTVIRPEPLADADAAQRWLADLRRDPDLLAAELAPALALVNRAIHVHRATVLDPNLPDVAVEHALAIRIGLGAGDELAEGRYGAAIELPPSARRLRGEVLRPQERLAAVLAGREQVAAFELLLLRARADLDAGREREAALQLRVALEALLADRTALDAPEQEEDLAALAGHRERTAAGAEEALRGGLSAERTAELTETLRIAERALRRRRALG